MEEVGFLKKKKNPAFLGYNLNIVQSSHLAPTRQLSTICELGLGWGIRPLELDDQTTYPAGELQVQ